jgi:hypothetical protein
MKKMPQFEITTELDSIIGAVRNAIDTRVQTDVALAKNFDDLKSAETELDNAKNALAERDADFALAIGATAVSGCEKAVKAAKAAVAAAGEKVESYVRRGGALRRRALDIDTDVVNLKSACLVEIDRFSQRTVEDYENILREAMKPLVDVLLIGAALARSLRNPNLNTTLYESVVHSPTRPMVPIIDRGGVSVDGSWLPFATIANSNEALNQIHDTLAPLREIQTALAAYSPFNPTAALPYVKQGYVINQGGRSTVRDPAPMASSTKASRVEPQEINVAPELVRLGEQQFDLNESLPR